MSFQVQHAMRRAQAMRCMDPLKYKMLQIHSAGSFLPCSSIQEVHSEQAGAGSAWGWL